MITPDAINKYFQNLLTVSLATTMNVAEHQHRLLSTLRQEQEDVTDAIKDFAKASQDARLDGFWAVMGVDKDIEAKRKS